MRLRSPWRDAVGRRVRLHLDSGASVEGRLVKAGSLLRLTEVREMSTGAELAGEARVGPERVVMTQVLD